jgi:nitrogen fixation NifU-like protein
VSDDLYNDAIVKAARAGARGERLPEPRVSVTRDNPLCGDRVTVDVRLEGDRVAAVGQKTRGCMLTQAAASLIEAHAAGAAAEELRHLGQEVKALLAGGPGTPSWPELEMFRPVSGVKSRHECVLLPFEALRAALEEGGDSRGQEQASGTPHRRA